MFILSPLEHRFDVEDKPLNAALHSVNASMEETSTQTLRCLISPAFLDVSVPKQTDPLDDQHQPTWVDRQLID